MLLPSGPQSAHSTSFRMSRGAAPPATESCASVPVPRKASMTTRFRRDRHVARFRDGQDRGTDETERPRLRALGTADENLHRPVVPGRRVHDRLAVGSEPGREHLPSAVRELSKGRRRPVTGLADCRERERGADGGRRDDRRGDAAPRPGVSPRRVPPWRRPAERRVRRALLGQKRRRAPSRTAPPGFSPGSAARSARARAGRLCSSPRGPAAPRGGSPTSSPPPNRGGTRGWPDSISYRIAPKENMSDRWSARFPFTCSGDM